PDQPAEHVAAEVIGPEPVRRAWRQQQLGDVLVDRRVRRQHRRKDRHNHQRNQKGDAEHCAQVAAHPAQDTRGTRPLPWDRGIDNRGHASTVRGSSRALSTSTRRLIRITITTSTRTTPCTTGKSLLSAEVATRLPTPGMANTASITTAPENSRLTCSPSRVSSVTLILRSPCFHSTAPADRPFARSVRIYCELSTSISALRTWRASSAITPTASAIAGRGAGIGAARGLVVSGAAHVVGNQCSCSDRVATRIMASQKLGSATPSEARLVMIESMRVPDRVAASTPSEMPTTPAITSA